MMHDVGGKVSLPLPIWVRSEAIFGGESQEYRYQLIRKWNDTLPAILWVMMNPSTAREDVDDPTVAKCRRYSELWGYGTMLIGNVFAYRATDQKRLMQIPDPIGPDNDAHLCAMARRAQLIVFAYGKPHKSLRSRGPQVARMLSVDGTRQLHALQLCADGTPSHPLYLKGNLQPIPWML